MHGVVACLRVWHTMSYWAQKSDHIKSTDTLSNCLKNNQTSSSALQLTWPCYSAPKIITLVLESADRPIRCDLLTAEPPEVFDCIIVVLLYCDVVTTLIVFIIHIYQLFSCNRWYTGEDNSDNLLISECNCIMEGCVSSHISSLQQADSVGFVFYRVKQELHDPWTIPAISCVVNSLRE